MAEEAMPADGELEQSVLEPRVVARVSLGSRSWRHGRSIWVVWCGMELWLMEFRADGEEFTASADRAFTA